MTDTTYKWGTAPGEYKSQEDAQRAKTKQKLKSRRIRKGAKGGGPLLRSVEALDRSFTRGGPQSAGVPWGAVARSIAKHLHKISPKSGGPAVRISGAGKQSIPGTKVEIPKKLTKSY
tara:strand:- start:3416 stop:3766 length:351 start_codon:yes stop_codon:yes gene_type:complete